MFSYPPSHLVTFTPYVQVTAREATDVVVAGLGSNTIYNLGDGESVVHNAGSTDRTTSGVEDKGWEVSSTKPVTVQVSILCQGQSQDLTEGGCMLE